jgi:hypothetical protein
VASGRAPTDALLWQETDLVLPGEWPSRWTCVISGRPLAARGGRLRAAELFGILPAALLLADTAS